MFRKSALLPSSKTSCLFVCLFETYRTDKSKKIIVRQWKLFYFSLHKQLLKSTGNSTLIIYENGHDLSWGFFVFFLSLFKLMLVKYLKKAAANCTPCSIAKASCLFQVQIWCFKISGTLLKSNTFCRLSFIAYQESVSCKTLHFLIR